MADPIDRLINELREEQDGKAAQDPLGKLLGELWEESKAPVQPKPQPRPAPPQVAAPPVAKRPVQPTPPPPPLPARPPPPLPVARPDGPTERALAQVAEEAKKQQRERAERWLRALDPYSTEGMWFHELASKYPSPLEAAIDYLEMVKKER